MKHSPARTASAKEFASGGMFGKTGTLMDNERDTLSSVPRRREGGRRVDTCGSEDRQWGPGRTWMLPGTEWEDLVSQECCASSFARDVEESDVRSSVTGGLDAKIEWKITQHKHPSPPSPYGTFLRNVVPPPDRQEEKKKIGPSRVSVSH